MKEIIKRLKDCNYALERAAFLHDGLKLKDLPKGIIESTGVGKTCLIEVRENNKLIEKLRKVE